MFPGAVPCVSQNTRPDTCIHRDHAHIVNSQSDTATTVSFPRAIELRMCQLMLAREDYWSMSMIGCSCNVKTHVNGFCCVHPRRVNIMEMAGEVSYDFLAYYYMYMYRQIDPSIPNKCSWVIQLFAAFPVKLYFKNTPYIFCFIN